MHHHPGECRHDARAAAGEFGHIVVTFTCCVSSLLPPLHDALGPLRNAGQAAEVSAVYTSLGLPVRLPLHLFCNPHAPPDSCAAQVRLVLQLRQRRLFKAQPRDSGMMEIYLLNQSALHDAGLGLGANASAVMRAMRTRRRVNTKNVTIKQHNPCASKPSPQRRQKASNSLPPHSSTSTRRIDRNTSRRACPHVTGCRTPPTTRPTWPANPRQL